MPIYLRFNDNGFHVETTTLSKKPEGEGWYKAPTDFDPTKRYQLREGDKIGEADPEVFAAEQLKQAKEQALIMIRNLIDASRQQYVGYSHGKNQAYMVQAQAAASILETLQAHQSVDDRDAQIIGPLAEVRHISLEAMAQKISQKAQSAAQGLAYCEKREDEAKEAIENIATLEELHKFLADFRV